MTPTSTCEIWWPSIFHFPLLHYRFNACMLQLMMIQISCSLNAPYTVTTSGRQIKSKSDNILCFSPLLIESILSQCNNRRRCEVFWGYREHATAHGTWTIFVLSIFVGTFAFNGNFWNLFLGIETWRDCILHALMNSLNFSSLKKKVVIELRIYQLKIESER